MKEREELKMRCGEPRSGPQRLKSKSNHRDAGGVKVNLNFLTKVLRWTHARDGVVDPLL